MRNPLLPTAFGALLLVACTPHKIELQQGNIITEEKLAQLKVGMEPKQVRFLLGTPLVSDPFHANRWDYFYSLKKEGEEVIDYRITLFFEADKLTRVEKIGTPPANEQQVLDLIQPEPEVR